MEKKKLPLKEVSIEELFLSGAKCSYEIPIYQRNYAWEKDEIAALVQDIYDAHTKYPNRPYYIGTLVSYHKGDQVYEVIDGQQRLTTIWLMLAVLNLPPQNQLAYRARKKSDDTLKAILNLKEADETDTGIENGLEHVKESIKGIISGDEELCGFTDYFRKNVHIIHYEVPKDIDLNHYFEVMNSRGEQLEKHEIVKANLMEKLETDEERKAFNRIWECCSEMSVYVQQNLGGVKLEDVFGRTLSRFKVKSFDDLLGKFLEKEKEDDSLSSISLADILASDEHFGRSSLEEKEERKDSFQPIIDFPNFLLIVLKIVRMEDQDFNVEEFTLDDKELLNEFRKMKMDADHVKAFAYHLLKARFFLDNYVVHHSREEDTMDSNPWKLQIWHKDEETKKGYLRNLIDDTENNDKLNERKYRLQERLVHLLSMFEVSFTARQRKNYLFYCLYYLIKRRKRGLSSYGRFVEGLADRYFYDVYLDGNKLNSINTPIPGSFDEVVLDGNWLNKKDLSARDVNDFIAVYGDGAEASRGVPLFVFNYMDYKLWKLYNSEMHGKEYKEENKNRRDFFERLGCSDFGLRIFEQFYFSRTRRSLEHYYPQALATGKNGALNQDQINCFGNYAMIGSEANSSGSNWTPSAKLTHYQDASMKIKQISVASLKFMIMMQLCRDNRKWEFEEIQKHQKKMISVLLES